MKFTIKGEVTVDSERDAFDSLLAVLAAISGNTVGVSHLPRPDRRRIAADEQERKVVRWLTQ